MTRTNRELKLIFAVIVALFAVFLAGPILILLGKSLWDGGLTGEFYASVLSQKGFLPALGNSFAVAGASAAAATLLAFSAGLWGCTTPVCPSGASGLSPLWLPCLCFCPPLPMALPSSIPLASRASSPAFWGRQLFDIYSFFGLMVGYVIYTIPVAFLLIHNTMGFVDKRPLPSPR